MATMFQWWVGGKNGKYRQGRRTPRAGIRVKNSGKKVEHTGQKIRVHAHVSKAQHELLKILSKRTGYTVAWHVREALKYYTKNQFAEDNNHVSS